MPDTNLFNYVFDIAYISILIILTYISIKFLIFMHKYRNPNYCQGCYQKLNEKDISKEVKFCSSRCYYDNP